MGINSAEADAEVVAMAIETVKAAGIDEFQIDIGQVGFFKGLMAESGLSEDEIEEVRELIDQKNLVGVEQVMDRHKVRTPLKRIILDLPKLFGSKDILHKINPEDIGKEATKAIENIKEVLEILEDRNLAQYVSLDLGMVRVSIIIRNCFQSYTYGVGFLFSAVAVMISWWQIRKMRSNRVSLGINMVMWL